MSTKHLNAYIEGEEINWTIKCDGFFVNVIFYSCGFRIGTHIIPFMVFKERYDLPETVTLKEQLEEYMIENPCIIVREYNFVMF